MPNLQEHMLRVAGVAKIISDNYLKTLNKELLLSSALIHDLGNMTKIKIDAFPEFAQPEGVDYWSKVLTEFKEKYGNDDYSATYTILKELNVPQDVYNLVSSLEFVKASQTAKSNNLELKICLYSDARVTPYGVASLQKRLSEVKDRYIRNKGVSEEKYNEISQSLYDIEKQIFANCRINPEDISEEKVKLLFNGLTNFDIQTQTINV